MNMMLQHCLDFFKESRNMVFTFQARSVAVLES